MDEPATITTASPVLRARGLCKRFGRRNVLESVDLELHRGEIVALLGPNGCGKTTLMSILVGLTTPQQGTVEISGRRIGWVPQGHATYGRLTVRENLELFAALLDPGCDAMAATIEAARTAGLSDRLDQSGWELSGGLRQRLSVAIGLLGDPDLLVLDEPSTGVDLYHRHAMWDLLRSRAIRGRSIVYSTHTLEDAAFADRVVVLVDSGIAYDGPLDAITKHDAPTHFETASDPLERSMLALWGHARQAPHPADEAAT